MFHLYQIDMIIFITNSYHQLHVIVLIISKRLTVPTIVTPGQNLEKICISFTWHLISVSRVAKWRLLGVRNKKSIFNNIDIMMNVSYRISIAQILIDMIYSIINVYNIAK